MDRFEGYKGVVRDRDNNASASSASRKPGALSGKVGVDKVPDMKPGAPEADTQHSSSEKGAKSKAGEIELKSESTRIHSFNPLEAQYNKFRGQHNVAGVQEYFDYRMPEKQEYDCCELFWHYLFILWDGVRFFQPAHYKLKRLRGKQPQCTHKLTSIAWIVPTILVLAVAIGFIYWQAENIGEESARITDIIDKDEYAFPVSQLTPLHFFTWFESDKLLQHIHDYQDRTSADAGALKHPDSKFIPLTYGSMTANDRQYVEDFLCKYTSTFYRSEKQNDTAEVKTLIKFGCQLMGFEAGGKLTLHHNIPEDAKESVQVTILQGQDVYGNPEVQQTTDSSIEFVKGSFNEYTFSQEYDATEMKDLQVVSALFHTTDKIVIESSQNETDLNSIYLSSKTIQLFNTNPVQIGKQKVENIKIEMLPEAYVEQSLRPSEYLLGFIPVEFENNVTEKLVFRKNQFIDENGAAPVIAVAEGASSNLKVIGDFNFHQRYTRVEFKTVYTFLVTLGGFKAVFDPILAFLLTFLTLSFFYQLSGILQEEYTNDAMKRMEQFLEQTQSTLTDLIPQVVAEQKQRDQWQNARAVNQPSYKDEMLKVWDVKQFQQIIDKIETVLPFADVSFEEARSVCIDTYAGLKVAIAPFQNSDDVIYVTLTQVMDEFKCLEYILELQNHSKHDLVQVIRKRIGFYDIFKLFDSCKLNEIEIAALKKENEEITKTVSRLLAQNRDQQSQIDNLKSILNSEQWIPSEHKVLNLRRTPPGGNRNKLAGEVISILSQKE